MRSSNASGGAWIRCALFDARRSGSNAIQLLHMNGTSMVRSRHHSKSMIAFIAESDIHAAHHVRMARSFSVAKGATTAPKFRIAKR